MPGGALLTKQSSRRGETNAPSVDVILPRGSLLSFGVSDAVTIPIPASCFCLAARSVSRK
jgi:hypothetical protein